MTSISSLSSTYICARCSLRQHALLNASRFPSLLLASRPSVLPPLSRTVTFICRTKRKYTTKSNEQDTKNASKKDEVSERTRGAMSERLAQMSEDSLEASPRSASKTVEDTGFSEELRKQLEDRIAGANFRNQNARALAQAGLPGSAGRGTREIAGAQPWTGEERVEDAALRMLNDSHKPLRGLPSGRIRTPIPAARAPSRIDAGRPKTRGSAGVRIARAREQSSLYGSIQDGDLTKAEREARMREMKERFQPHARAVVPGTIQGLASLANERIEDAIARGQFKNLPRGQKIERDYTASSPFLDTTEYFMNKIIQKQEIVPPWIEKQQELVSEACRFRARLRNDWKRHAARVIASKGGSLEEQMARARQYAEAELRVNPQAKKEERMNTINTDGMISQISLSGELHVPPAGSPDTVPEEQILVTETQVQADAAPAAIPSRSSANTAEDAMADQPPVAAVSTASDPSNLFGDVTSAASPTPTPLPQPFRDPAYLATEESYHRAFITSINNATRSYNLLAPRVAQKPYFNLERELNSMYADVVPELAGYIRARALAPKAKATVFVDATGAGKGVLGGLIGEGRVKIRDERKDKKYGIKEFWRDLWDPRDT